MADVATVGEALVAMDPVSVGRLRGVDYFRKSIGGAEVNVAVALSRLGHRAAWFGALGDDEFGAQVLGFLRAEGVDAAGAVLDPNTPTGVYFKERGALGRIRVSYYRAGSAASRLQFESVDLDRLFSARVVHLTGITPALSDGCRQLTMQLAEEANSRGVMLSFDANIRFRLFSDRDPRAALIPIVERADLLFLSNDEATVLLGDGAPETVRRAAERLRATTVVVHGASGAFAVRDDGVVERPAYRVTERDTVGAGDAFVAGFLAGSLRGWATGRCLEFANACGACAVASPGDADSMPFDADALALLGDAGVEAER
jgi:2-dehydro-3-deoxygluconokinase